MSHIDFVRPDIKAQVTEFDPFTNGCFIAHNGESFFLKGVATTDSPNPRQWFISVPQETDFYRTAFLWHRTPVFNYEVLQSPRSPILLKNLKDGTVKMITQPETPLEHFVFGLPSGKNPLMETKPIPFDAAESEAKKRFGVFLEDIEKLIEAEINELYRNLRQFTSLVIPNSNLGEFDYFEQRVIRRCNTERAIKGIFFANEVWNIIHGAREIFQTSVEDFILLPLDSKKRILRSFDPAVYSRRRFLNEGFKKLTSKIIEMIEKELEEEPSKTTQEKIIKLMLEATDSNNPKEFEGKTSQKASLKSLRGENLPVHLRLMANEKVRYDEIDEPYLIVLLTYLGLSSKFEKAFRKIFTKDLKNVYELTMTQEEYSASNDS